MKLPKKETAVIPRLARQMVWFMLGLSGSMLFLLLLLTFLAARQGKSIAWGVIVGWLLIFIGWPFGIGIRQCQRYRQACELEREYLMLMGKIIGFAYQQIGSLEAAPTSDVYGSFSL